MPGRSLRTHNGDTYMVTPLVSDSQHCQQPTSTVLVDLSERVTSQPVSSHLPGFIVDFLVLLLAHSWPKCTIYLLSPRRCLAASQGPDVASLTSAARGT